MLTKSFTSIEDLLSYAIGELKRQKPGQWRAEFLKMLALSHDTEVRQFAREMESDRLVRYQKETERMTQYREASEEAQITEKAKRFVDEYFKDGHKVIL